jgi:NAD(P)-dependent dehydrogenase (short-subunit alcohol dehydrogenase family)
MELRGLDGRGAIVTGGSRGIGRAIAETLALCGAKVLCCARNETQLREACKSIQEKGGTVHGIKADVSSASDRRMIINEARGLFGRVDILINNAGIHYEKSALDLSDEEMRFVLETNFLSMFALARDVAREMIDGGGGIIVNMGSFWGQFGIRKQLAYCVSKAAIEALTRCLAVELADHNIRVVTVAPGHILTDISRPALENEKLRERILRKIPARRIGSPEEVAYLVAFLCSEQASYITGHVYYIDGGQSIVW